MEKSIKKIGGYERPVGLVLVAEQRRDGASAVGSRVIRDGEDLGLDVGDAGDVDRPRRRLVSFFGAVGISFGPRTESEFKKKYEK